MMNGDAILAQVQQGTWPPAWQVFRARPSHFLRLALLYGILLLVLVAGLVYLVSTPNEVFTLGYIGSSDGSTLDPGTFNLWRIVDFSLIAFLLVVFAGYAVYLLVQSTSVSQQLLVVLPEGFVINLGKTRTFPFANLRALSANSYRGVTNIRMTAVDGRALRVRLDGRFGNSRQVAQRILTASNQFKAPVARPPTPYSA